MISRNDIGKRGMIMITVKSHVQNVRFLIRTLDGGAILSFNDFISEGIGFNVFETERVKCFIAISFLRSRSCSVFSYVTIKALITICFQSSMEEYSS